MSCNSFLVLTLLGLYSDLILLLTRNSNHQKAFMTLFFSSNMSGHKCNTRLVPKSTFAFPKITVSYKKNQYTIFWLKILERNR